MLQDYEITKKLFSEESILKIRDLGMLTINEQGGPPSPELVKELIKDADAAITSWGCPPFTEDMLEGADNLKVIIHAAGSVKEIAQAPVWRRGIRVANSAEPLGKGVAETALGLTISSMKNIWKLSRSIAAGGWSEGSEEIRELYDVNIGVVGAGYAGRHYIKLLQNFEVNVLLSDPAVSGEQAAALGARKVSFEELLGHSDVVSIHAPSLPGTYHMFNRDTLKLMKKDAVLINTARGALVDETALYMHMLDGNLKYACLDVTDPEPPLKENPLRGLDNVIMTPHLAGLANNGRKRIGRHVALELAGFINGKRMNGEVTEEMLGRNA